MSTHVWSPMTISNNPKVTLDLALQPILSDVNSDPKCHFVQVRVPKAGQLAKTEHQISVQDASFVDLFKQQH